MSCVFVCFFFFKQKTAYEMRISEWSSDVCSSDLHVILGEYDPWRRAGAAGDVQFAFRGAILWRTGACFPADGIGVIHSSFERRSAAQEIGRASCRERVCQYV